MKLPKTVQVFGAVGLLLLFSAGLTYADKSQFEAKKSDRFELRLSQVEIEQTTNSAKELSHAIDLWHDANLKSDESKAGQYFENIIFIIRSDIAISQSVVKRLENEVNSGAAKVQANENVTVGKVEDGKEFRSDFKDLKQARILTKVKEKLLFSINHSDSFSNKYRLLNDYLDILGQQLGKDRMELAEDAAAWR